MGRSIFYLHPPKDDGFSELGGVRIFPSKKPTKFRPFRQIFQRCRQKKNPGSDSRHLQGGANKKWNLSTHNQTVVNNIAECSKKTSYLLIN